jgi:hypothetical protein
MLEVCRVGNVISNFYELQFPLIRLSKISVQFVDKVPFEQNDGFESDQSAHN